jgi:hypothetical protein
VGIGQKLIFEMVHWWLTSHDGAESANPPRRGQSKLFRLLLAVLLC